MKKIVTTSGEILRYKPVPLYLGVNLIDKKIAKENLLITKQILEEYSIKYALLAGTLLGAIREHDFIEHDEDIDLFIFAEDRQKVIDLLPLLIAKGFQIARFHRTKKIISIIRKGQYIDFNFFDVYNDEILCAGGWLVLSKFFYNLHNSEFLGSEYPMPIDAEGYLESAYGKNWRIPIKWNNYEMSWINKRLHEIKEFIKSILPLSIYMYFNNRRDNTEMKMHFRKFTSYCNNNNLPLVDYQRKNSELYYKKY